MLINGHTHYVTNVICLRKKRKNFYYCYICNFKFKQSILWFKAESTNVIYLDIEHLFYHQNCLLELRNTDIIMPFVRSLYNKTKMQNQLPCYNS